MIRFRSIIFLLFLNLYVLVLWSQQHTNIQVLFTTPVGVTASIDQSTRIVVTFNEPMTALAAVPLSEGTAPMSIEPFVRGTYRWLGTTTLAFTPADTLPFATHYTVTIPAGTKSLSGSTLKNAYRWSFETPRPAVIRINPFAGQKRVELDHSILVTFNEPVDPQTIGAWLSMEERFNGSIIFPTFSVRRAKDEELAGIQGSTTLTEADARLLAEQRGRSIVILPSTPFPKACTVTIVCKAGLQGKQGRLGMATEFSASFTTFGELKLSGVTCDDNTNPNNGLRFNFSNPVRHSELISHLVITPAASVSQNTDTDYQSDTPLAYLDLRPEQEYTGVVRAGMKDSFGNILATDVAFTFRTPAYMPYVRMTTGPGLLEAQEAHSIPVSLMNTDSVSVRMGVLPVDRIVPLMAASDFWGNDQWSESLLYGVEAAHNNSYPSARMWKLMIPHNTGVTKPLDLNEALGSSRCGVVFVELNTMHGNDPRVLKSIVQVTDIGLTAKFSPDSILIWATRLADVSPVVAADIEIRTDSNRVVWRGRTDASGLCSAPGWGRLAIEPVRETYGENDEYESVRAPRLWVIVKSGDDCAFTSSQWNEGIEPYTFGLDADWNPQFEKYEASVFTDRGLYKANETVGLKAIVRMRREGEWCVASQALIRVRITDPRGDEIYSHNVDVNAFGSFSLSIPLKATAPTGFYRIFVEVQAGEKLKRRWASLADGEFRVEAFRAAEFEVTATSGRECYILGDTVNSFFNAHYLFGAPMKQAPVQWRLSLNPTVFTPDGYDAYSFGTVDWLSDFSREASYQSLASGSGMLDEYGSIAVSTPLHTQQIHGTASLMLEADAVSPSRQTLSGRTSVIVHGGEYYVGVRPSATFIAADSVLSLSLVTVTKEGIPVTGRSLIVKMYQRLWHSVRKAETGGRYAWQTEVADSLIDSATVMSAFSPSVCSFTPKRAGFYYFSTLSTDDRGNILETQTTLYVSGSDYVAWNRNDDDRIELIADRKNYKTGETAKIVVKNPYESATALVSIEREGILSHYTTTLVGSAPQIDIPIENNYLPNVFVSVVLLQGRIGKVALTPGTDIGRPAFKIGYVQLSVSPKEKSLRVSVTSDRTEYRPGDSVTVAVAVRDANGRGIAGEVALSVADIGVLNLINYHLPDPFDAFYRERGLAVTTTETRLHLIEQRSYGEKGENVGGGGAAMKDATALDEEGMRKNFRPSAYWNPSLTTNDSGNAVVRFKLPDNITAFRAMAVAQTIRNEFGKGEFTINVNKPVLLLPSLPRFARAGDSFEAGVVVMNTTATPRIVTVTRNASGIHIRGNDSITVDLKPGQAREITYHCTSERIGTATVNATVVSSGEKDGLRWTFPVIAPHLRETVALFNASADAKKEEAIRTPENIIENTGDIEFTASSTALVGISGAMSYLFSYPYGCLEQRASCVLPMLLAKDVVDAFGFDVFKGKNLQQTAQKAVDEISLFQKYDGGFSLWKNDNESSPYISAYALYTLIQAQRNTISVDKRVIENGLLYLSRVVSGEERDVRLSIAANACTRALIVYTLALAKRPDFGTMDKLYSERTSLPLFAKAYLLKAVALSQNKSPMVAELARDLANHAKIDPVTAHFEEQNDNGLAWIYNSTTRTTALILQALIETTTDNDLVPKMVRWLLNAQRNGRWRTTQENIFVVDALASYFKKYENETPRFTGTIAVEGRQVLAQMFTGRSTETKKYSMPLSDLGKRKQARVTIGKEGTGRLYYGMRMTYFPKGQSTGRDEGVTVLRSMEPAEGTILTTIRPGLLMKVTVTVIAHQDRNYLVVDDPVPSGCEVVSTSFQTAASNIGESHDRFTVFNHIERYDDHVSLFADSMPAGIHSYTYLIRSVYAGTFMLPSTRAECMYEPEVFARTASTTVIIR